MPTGLHYKVRYIFSLTVEGQLAHKPTRRLVQEQLRNCSTVLILTILLSLKVGLSPVSKCPQAQMALLQPFK